MSADPLRLDPKALPCPFCGAIPRVDFGTTGPRGKRRPMYLVSCDISVCAVAPSVSAKTREGAIAAWNRRAALPVPTSEEPREQSAERHTFVPAMDGGSASCAECGESWPCKAWIEQQRVRRDDPALLRQAVIDCLPPEIVKLAENIYAPTLGGMLMEYVAELEGQLEDAEKSPAPVPPVREDVERAVADAIKHFGKTVCAIARVQPTWTLTTVMNDEEAQRCATALLAMLVPPAVPEAEIGEPVAWHLHPSVVETARQLHRHLATANRSAQWLNEAYELCQRLGDAVATRSAHPAPVSTEEGNALPPHLESTDLLRVIREKGDYGDFSPAPVPEVREEDVAWLKEAADDRYEWHPINPDTALRILSVLESIQSRTTDTERARD